MRPVSDKLAPRLFAGAATAAVAAVLWTAVSGADDSRASVEPEPKLRTESIEFDLGPEVHLASVPDVAPEPTDSIEESEEEPSPAEEVLVRMDPARAAAAEQRAIQTLLAIARAQSRAHGAGVIDTDADGVGEYGYLAELRASAPMRGHDAGSGLAIVTDRILDPAHLDPSIGSMRGGGSGGVLEVDGYAFQVFLPAPADGGAVRGIAEASAGGASNELPGADTGELHYCCYAWPASAAGPGQRAFFINERGDVFACANDGGARYAGVASGPAFDAAYTVRGDMSSIVASKAAPAVDGRGWASIDD